MQRKRTGAGFTLIELMVVVGIVGVLSAIAIPSFAIMVKRSKTAEVSGNLNAMFKHAASYYSSERSTQGQVSSVSGYCTVQDANQSPPVPRKIKQPFSPDASFRALGYSIGDQVYYSYGLVAQGGTSKCARVANSTGLYTFFAHGDLDSNNVVSTFELAAGSDASNVLYHARGFHIEHETE
ncbi:MAG: hypothetical protein RL701_6336 [Pseudomonadota bacterium]|jgi:prepilin-type N-terminal cleavage/methylation domain-containing protein